MAPHSMSFRHPAGLLRDVINGEESGIDCECGYVGEVIRNADGDADDDTPWA